MKLDEALEMKQTIIKNQVVLECHFKIVLLQRF